MRISILTTSFFHDAKEVTRMVQGKPVKGKDKIIWGGAEKYTIDLCHLLQEDGHTVSVYQPFPGIPKPFSKQFKGITFVMIPNNGGWEYNTCTDLNWQFNEYSVMDDLRIYMAQYLAWPNAVSPCIAISHGIYWDNIQGNNVIKNMSDSQKREFFKRQLYGFTQADACVSVDSNVRKVIQSMDPGSEKRIHIIYNYVDCKKFKPVQKTWEGINVLFPRRLTVLRGSTEVTRAFIRYPEYNFTLVGQAHDEKAAQAYMNSHKHRGNVKFIHRPMDEMPEVYQKADISLIPTISTEGTSLSLLESMASGLPVITTPVGGLGDAVIDGYNALIYDPNHDELGEHIKILAEDEEMRKIMARRNREIACECFDIEIWKQRWRSLLAQFGAVPEKQYPGHTIIDESVVMDDESFKRLEKICNKETNLKPKLTAMMLTHNEADRYLEEVIENTLLFCDQIVILDDHSTDKTLYTISELAERFPHRISVYYADNSWENESLLRNELLHYALEGRTDWLIAIDADELYEADKMNEHLPYLMSQTDAEWVGFRFYDMWDKEHYRDDDVWPSGMTYAPRMFRVKDDNYIWHNKRRHCGSIPANVLEYPGINSSVRVKHLGWMKNDDRDKKYLDRIRDDPDNKFFPQDVYNAILDANPTLVKWENNNIWQTSKLTIAYPEGMEWDVMQQRPHHLLRLAANERNRVFFGDDTVTGVYEVLPYLNLTGRDAFDSLNSVDLLYITSPEQMKSCEKLSYKKLVYDCCDWMYGNDRDLISKADYVLCASKIIYDKVAAIKDKVIYLPNACDFVHFSKTGEPSKEIPEPVIGYMGCIHPAMIDESIVKAIAEKYKLLMIGQQKGMSFRHPNIYGTGHIEYKKLTGLLSQCKVGIIPFRTDSDYLKYSAPIKVYEYLASGRPVVASPIPELIPLAEQGLIHIVPNEDLEGWLTAVAKAIEEYPNKKGQEWAKGQDWTNRWKIIKQEVLCHE